MAHDIALSHHERWDGAGYPQGLAGAAIPEPARILSIVDVYDAVSHDRVYRRAMPEDEVLTLMQQGVGTQFDPMLVAVFLAHFEEMRRIARENPDEAASFAPLSLASPAPTIATVLSPVADASASVVST